MLTLKILFTLNLFIILLAVICTVLALTDDKSNKTILWEALAFSSWIIVIATYIAISLMTVWGTIEISYHT